ncbi:LysR substrate-binding domain-containing protein [Alteromonas halophila]|uniref:LysR family transcriptional regulator n=1 Tax=Alteromonas halophila TaxID=516698 RepID=A0A918JN57_9ALTE|nr:LysR substrate-binding domain-containing protein [Alteromonas halophila]GGW91027.1 LysR family transcriptional regulator [Alteromonas halophila]
MKATHTWQGIAEFVGVVESGSFTAASRRLQVSNAQVSRQVSQLEQRLGVQLLHRTTRRVKVTEPGQRYYQQCRQLIDGFNACERALTEQQASPRGTLRLTAPINYGERVLMPLLITFQQRYPQLHLDIELSNARLDIVDAGLDMAIRLGRLQDSRLRHRQLASRKVHTCASPGYLAAHGCPTRLSDLDSHNCLVGSLGYWRFADNGREQTLNVSGSLRCNSGLSLRDCALQDIGIIQLPEEYVAPCLKDGTLVEILIDQRPDSEGIWGLYPQTRWVAPGVSLLLDYLQAQLQT